MLSIVILLLCCCNIAISPGLLLGIQSLDWIEREKGRRFFLSSVTVMSHSSAAAGKPPGYSLKIKRNIWRQAKTVVFLLYSCNFKWSSFSPSLPSLYKPKRMTIMISIGLHKYCLLDLSPSAFIIMHEQIHILTHVDYILQFTL